MYMYKLHRSSRLKILNTEQGKQDGREREDQIWHGVCNYT